MVGENVMKKTKVFWINCLVGLVWFGIALRDLFAPRLFRFDGQVASNSTITLNFVVAAAFLFVAFAYRKPRSSVRSPNPK
jgi:hypothetical protein